MKSGPTSFFTQPMLACLRNKWPSKMPTGEAGIKSFWSGVCLKLLWDGCIKSLTLSMWLIWAQLGLVKAEDLAHPPGWPQTPIEKLQSPLLAPCLNRASSIEEGCPSHQCFWNNHLVSSGRLILPGCLLLSMSLISIIDVLLTHTDKHMSEFTHKCTFSRGSCCFLLQ